MKMELEKFRRRVINALVIIFIVSITLSLVILFSEGRLFDWHYFLDNIDSYFQFTWISIILSIAAKKKKEGHMVKEQHYNQIRNQLKTTNNEREA